MNTDWANVISFVWFALCWVGYTYLAKHRAKSTDCIAAALHDQRRVWMTRMMERTQRVSDAALLASLERNVTFFASTTMLVVAGLLTMFSATDYVLYVASKFPFAAPTTHQEIQLKLALLLAIFIYAFFTFTWSMRQYGFCSVLMGAAHEVSVDQASDDDTRAHHQDHMYNLAKVIDRAGHSYNYGLRSYYFAMATLAWFMNPCIYILASTLVVVVLYRREFHSATFKVLQAINNQD